jgi:hypothetical protein
MNMQNVLDALKAAGVPPFVAKTSLPKEGQDGLRKFVQDTEYSTTEGLLSYRLIGVNDDKVVRVAAVLAKELILSKAGKVVYLPAALMRHHAAFYDRHSQYSDYVAHLAGMKIAILPDLFQDGWYGNDMDRQLTFQMVQRLYYGGVMLIVGEGRQEGIGFADRSFDQFLSGLPELHIA